MPTRDWDAQTYDRISRPMEEMGSDVLTRLALRGDETVLDAGCGSGRVTALLRDRLPHGRVIAVDGSPAMVEETRARLGEGADVRVADLLELDLGEQVDHVLSTATFHWIADHPRLFARMHAALRPGGRLVAQCGGAGNIARVGVAIADAAAREPFAPFIAGFDPWNFAGPDETEARLREAGFTEARCWLVERPVVTDHPYEWLATIMLGSHHDRLPEGLRDPFTRAVRERLSDPVTLDYVRLNIDAIA